MLKVRVITALILAPVVTAAIYLLPEPWLAVFFTLVAGLAMYEWAGLLQLQQWWQKAAYVAVYVALVAVFWFAQRHLPLVLLAAGVFWVFAFVAVVAYPKGAALVRHRLFVALAGWLVGVGAWAGLVSLRFEPNGAHWIMWILVLCWSADVGAYFAGRGFGRNKLAPSVSPGKTWEGVAGGWLLASVICLGLLAAGNVYSHFAILVVAVLVGVSIVGDLFESVLKRLSDVKDSGSLLPGHGGVLDRVDSVLAAVPVFALLKGLIV